MDDKAAYWASVGLSALALLLLVTNVALVSGNRNLQIEINQRQAAINNGVNLSQLNNGLVQALADIAVKNDDKDVRDLLTTQGISLKPKAEQKTDAAKETKKK